MKFSHRLGLSAGVALVALIIALLFSVLGLQGAKKRTDKFLQLDQVMFQQENLIYNRGLQLATAIRNIVMNPANKAAHEQLKLSGEIIENAALRLRELATAEPETQAMVTQLLELRAQQDKIHAEIVANASNLWLAVSKIAEDETPVWREIRLLVTKSMEVRSQKMGVADQELASFMSRTAWVSAILGVLGTILGVVLMVLFGRSILRQLGGDPSHAAEVARTISAGDFTQQISLREGDDSSLMYFMAQMQASLIQMTHYIQRAAEAIDEAANEIRHGNEDLSARTESQAAGLEQTAAAMEEITSTVRLNADNATEGNQVANRVSDIAIKSGSAVDSAVSTMNEIRDSSERMVEIINTIESIAFQTNILALNAAVEAARAGEQGRGFAVVASEVRSLAQRSGAAASDIKQLIDTSVERIAVGDTQITVAGDAVLELMQAIKDVARIMGEITNASQEQTIGINEIGQAVRQMDDATQQNSALVQEATAAARSLVEQSTRLKNIVGAFKVP